MKINIRLDVYVAERECISRSASQRLIENGYVTVNGVTQPKNYRLREGDEINVEDTEPEPATCTAQDIPLDVVYEDSSLIVVNKPKGMVVHPAAGNPSGTLVNALLFHCGDSLSGIGGVIRPGIVHRLDRDTSGLLIVAKNDAAHLFIAEQLKSHKLGRIYEAVIIGRLKEPDGTVNAPVGRHPVDRKKMAVTADGREAVTHYRLIREYDTIEGCFSHIELRLETGRTHQIRVHMAHIGHPVLGDAVYGKNNSRFEIRNAGLLSGQCLHARTVEFIHPVTGKFMRFDSGLPVYFNEIIEKLELSEK
jgi:23S rRNA pseudouridine1911/1915/1917 synthase